MFQIQRITDLLSLDCHLVYLPCSTRAILSWLSRTLSRWGFFQYMLRREMPKAPWAARAHDWLPFQWKAVCWLSVGTSCVSCRSIELFFWKLSSLTRHLSGSRSCKYRSLVREKDLSCRSMFLLPEILDLLKVEVMFNCISSFKCIDFSVCIALGKYVSGLSCIKNKKYLNCLLWNEILLHHLRFTSRNNF